MTSTMILAVLAERYYIHSWRIASELSDIAFLEHCSTRVIILFVCRYYMHAVESTVTNMCRLVVVCVMATSLPRLHYVQHQYTSQIVQRSAHAWNETFAL